MEGYGLSVEWYLAEMISWLYIIWTQMLIGNFSFAILVVGVLQLITMINNRRPKLKLVNLDHTLIDPLKVIDIKLFVAGKNGTKFNYYVEVVHTPEESTLLYGTDNVKRAHRKYKKVYKKIYKNMTIIPNKIDK